ncbi:hypothetical protein RQP46_002999 [Phenoliferia psychrophenolica]
MSALAIAPSQSAASLLRASLAAHRFSSGSAALDSLLTPSALASRPGLAHGQHLELMGPPGIGKTRTALGFILEARFNAVLNDTSCEVLVVDAEGSLSPELIHSTAVEYATYNTLPTSAPRQVCEGIHYKRICDISLLVAFYHTLPSWLNAHPDVKLVVLDSLTAHLRPSTFDFKQREYFLQLIKTTLTTVATHHDVSVITTTQLTLKLFDADGRPSQFTSDAEALLVPPLGDSWIGGQCWRVVLYFDSQGERQASLVSSPVPSRGTEVAFQMDALGPCDWLDPDVMADDDHDAEPALVEE